MKNLFDLVIVGAGPAGLSAALAAAPTGKSIAIIDDNLEVGGQIWRNSTFAPNEIALKKRKELNEYGNVTFICSAKIVAAFFKGNLLLELPNHSLNLYYRRLILCTGARELFLPFPGWTLPGVVGAGGLQALIKGGMPVKNEKIVIAGTGPLLLASADTAIKSGAQVLCIAEQASNMTVMKFVFSLWRWPNKIKQAWSLPHQLYQYNSYIIEAIGDKKLESVKLKTAKGIQIIQCDRLAVGYSLIPNIQLGQMLGCEIHENKIAVNTQQETSLDGVFAAGECTGFGGSELAIIEGTIAGLVAVGLESQITSWTSQRTKYQKFADLLNTSFALRKEVKNLSRADTIFCRCEDVQYHQIVSRKSWIDAKLHTRCGMGACQGRMCSAAAASLFNWELPKSRLPLFPTRAENLVNIQSRSLDFE